MTVEEYQIAQLYSVAEASKNETGGGEGIEVVRNEPFYNHPLLGGKYHTGQYTYKIYHVSSKVPGFIRLLAPKGSLEIHEEAWNAYPYCRTVITNPTYMKEKFIILIESFHIDDRGDKYNVHELTEEKLRLRKVVTIDIGLDPVQASDYKSDEDPTKFVSCKTQRGPLVGNWRETVNPVMTCYKLVTVEFKWFGLQNRVETYIQKGERRLFTAFHRQVFCWMDRWHGLTLAEIRMIEERTKEELRQQINVGEVKGMMAE